MPPRGRIFFALLPNYVNKMIAAGQVTAPVTVERFISFGTPEDLAAAEANEANARALRAFAGGVVRAA